MIILFYFPKLQFENMIDCFAMFTSLLNISLAQLFSLVGLHKIEAFLADGFMKPPKRQAKISGHAVHYIYDCCEKTDLVEAFSAIFVFSAFCLKNTFVFPLVSEDTYFHISNDTTCISCIFVYFAFVIHTLKSQWSYI